jgi:hypothetical protein
LAHVYGFESGTLETGATAHFLAMELVEGEDLSERLKRGLVPVHEALEIARQAAEAPPRHRGLHGARAGARTEGGPFGDNPAGVDGESSSG